jgi:protein-S-isoprenylcysteine O-methyltransferase Ste14
MSDATLPEDCLLRLRSARVWDSTARALGALWFLALAVAMAWPNPAAPMTTPAILAKSCIALFYLILWWLLIVRPPAKAEASGIAPRIAAFAGTYMPWTTPFLCKPVDSASLDLLSASVSLVGMAMVIVTIVHLGKAFSLVPQARTVVRSGPYRWLRHPLYLSEEIAVFGMALHYSSLTAFAILAGHIGLQVRRIYYEEALLRRSFPQYDHYAASTWRLVPFLW